MITARAVHRDGRYELTVRGHADYAPKGRDIVCAGASALLYALAGALEEQGCRPAVRLEQGMGRVACAGGGAAALYRMAVVGFQQLAAAYPQHVRITMEGFSKEPQGKENV